MSSLSIRINTAIVEYSSVDNHLSCGQLRCRQQRELYRPPADGGVDCSEVPELPGLEWLGTGVGSEVTEGA